MIAHTPLIAVGDVGVLWQLNGFGKVDQPYAGLCAIVHKQQRAADHFVCLEEIRLLQRCSDGTETLHVFGLEFVCNTISSLIEQLIYLLVRIVILTVTCGKPCVKSLKAA